MQTFNTGETQADLRQTYNPDGSPLRRAQLRMLDMVDYLFDAADKAGVDIRIDGGNVLGAVRHSGFIPWDDDFDTVISRADYIKLCRYLKEHPHPQFVLQTPETDPGSFVPWGRLRDLKSEYSNPYPADSPMGRAFDAQHYKGVQIDIFPYEDYMIPWLQRLAAKMACVVHFQLARRSLRLATTVYRLLHRVVYPCFRLIGRCFGRADCYMHAYGTWHYPQFPKDVLLPHRDITFEGRTYKGPADPVRFCALFYKDYMNLPPKDKRAVHSSGIRIDD